MAALLAGPLHVLEGAVDPRGFHLLDVVIGDIDLEDLARLLVVALGPLPGSFTGVVLNTGGGVYDLLNLGGVDVAPDVASLTPVTGR